MEFIQIEVQSREERGTATARRLRREGAVPAVLYGLKRRNLPLAIRSGEMERFLKTGSHLVELRMGEETRTAILREIQVDPVTEEILHVDFVRVDRDHEVEDRVPLVFKGRAKGTREGGLFQALLDHVEVRCRPRDIPRDIVVEVEWMTLGDAVHVKDLTLPAKVELVSPPEELVAHVVPLRGVALPEEEAAAAEEAEAEAGEPEVIGRGEEPAAEEPTK